MCIRMGITKFKISFERYNVGYTVGNHVLRLRISLNLISARNPTKSFQNGIFEYSDPLTEQHTAFTKRTDTHMTAINNQSSVKHFYLADIFIWR